MRMLAVAALAAAVAVGPADAKTFTWSFNADILTLDPHSSNHTFTNAFNNNIYEGLTRHNAKMEIEPALAERVVSLLEAAGLVRRQVKGRTHLCRLDAARLAEAEAWLGYYERFWTGRLDALAALLQAEDEASR